MQLKTRLKKKTFELGVQDFDVGHQSSLVTWGASLRSWNPFSFIREEVKNMTKFFTYGRAGARRPRIILSSTFEFFQNNFFEVIFESKLANPLVFSHPNSQKFEI